MATSLPKTKKRHSPYLRSKRKRIIDVFVACLGLAMTAVLTVPVGVLIKLDSRGPIFYRQTRLGLDGKRFKLIKFRTMNVQAEVDGPVWAKDDDPRVTKIGKVLRRFYIDEFPQWWNVIAGNMSLVGPRPERPEMNSIIVQRYPEFLNRLEAKPGITGLAQTEYRYTRSVVQARNKLNYDQRYIANASFFLDLWVIVRTFRRMLLRPGQ